MRDVKGTALTDRLAAAAEAKAFVGKMLERAVELDPKLESARERLKKLRAQYMVENKTCGLHPESFRRAVERVAA